VSTRGGKVALALAALAVAVAAYATWRVSAYHANLVVLDALMLVALFFTGRSSEITPSLRTGPAALLQRIAREVRKKAPGARVVPWARFPQGQSEPDELRLLVMPKAALRGLNGIEVGCAFPAGAGGAIECPEILVRVAEETDAARKARSLVPFGRWVHGRKAGELVLSLEPRSGSWRSTVALVQGLMAQLSEEKKAPQAVDAKEPARKETPARGAAHRPALA